LIRAGNAPARFLFRFQAQSWVEPRIGKVDDEVRDRRRGVWVLNMDQQ
jgi:hypothetical protein